MLRSKARFSFLKPVCLQSLFKLPTSTYQHLCWGYFLSPKFHLFLHKFYVRTGDPFLKLCSMSYLWPALLHLHADFTWVSLYVHIIFNWMDDVDSGWGGEPVRSGVHLRAFMETWLMVDLTEGQGRGMRDGMK